MAVSKPIATCKAPGQRRVNTDQSELNIRFVLDTFRNWWKVVIPLGLFLGATGGVLAYLGSAPRYEAVAWLRIDEKPAYLAYEPGYEGRTQGFVQTQLELLRSPLVLGEVVHTPSAANCPQIADQVNPLEWLTKAISVKPVGQSELYRVSIATTNPQQSVSLVNAVIDAYFKLRGHEQSDRSQQMIASLEDERQRRTDEIAALRESLETLSKKVTSPAGGRPGVSTAASVEDREIVELQRQLLQAEVDREVLQAKIKTAEKSAALPESVVTDSAIEKIVEEDVEIRKLKQTVVAQRATLDEIEKRSATGKQDPIYREVAKEQARNEQILQQRGTAQRQRGRAEMIAIAQTKANQELTALRRELESRLPSEQAMRRRYEAQVQALKQPDNSILELDVKRSDLARAEKVLDVLVGRLAKLRTEQRAPGQVTLLRRAELPPAPVEMVPVKQIAVASLAGLCLPFLLALGWERLVRHVNGADNLSEQSNLTLLGEVPRIPSRSLIVEGESSRRNGAQWQLFEESVDSLRTTLMLSEGSDTRRVLAVTSAVSGEGKTSIASQLAVSIGRATGRSTLLIDGDMRSPNIHNIYRVRMEPGLAELLNGEVTVDETIVKIDGVPVDVIPAGRLSHSPHKLLGNGSFDRLLKQLAQRYEYIVLDTPPLLAAGEALVLARAADGCLICAMQQKSRIEQVEKARQRLEEIDGHVLGVVLSGVPTPQYAYRYGRYAGAPV